MYGQSGAVVHKDGSGVSRQFYDTGGHSRTRPRSLRIGSVWRGQCMLIAQFTCFIFLLFLVGTWWCGFGALYWFSSFPDSKVYFRRSVRAARSFQIGGRYELTFSCRGQCCFTHFDAKSAICFHLHFEMHPHHQAVASESARLLQIFSFLSQPPPTST